jgi:exo-beta-1,3-glucanase (GH17 family)
VRSGGLLISRAGALVACIGLLSLAVSSVAAAAPECQDRPQARPAITRLREALAHGRFVAYTPTSLQVVDGRVTPANEAGIRDDLTVLRQHFDSLITYDALHGAENIPPIAASLRFRALIIGVWNPFDEREPGAAIDAARRFPSLVVGISLGNELWLSQRSDPERLAALIARVRAQVPGTALTTTEPFHLYYEPAAAPLLGQLDFVLVNVHPIFQPWFRDAPDSAAARFVVNVLDKLAPLVCGPILVKETGVPTAPQSAGYSEDRQASFYRELRAALPASRTRGFAYFAAFDAPWRASDAMAVPGQHGAHPEEAHWGLFDAERHPKAAARELPPL